MKTTITVENVLTNRQAYDGQVISVEGQFIGVFDNLVICSPSEDHNLTPERPQIKLEAPDLEMRCLQIIPAIVGGPMFYDHPAVVRGRFSANPEPTLVELTSLVATRNGRKFEVSF